MRTFQSMFVGGALDDRVFAGVGAALGIAFTGLLAALLAGRGPEPLLIAPIGASAVLVFAVPASPLAQPWPVIGGNMLSALFALLVVRLVPHEAGAAALAVGGAIVLMALARCLHPPGGAVALGVVLLGHGAGQPLWSFPVVPVGLDSLLLVAAGVAFHRWSAHGYPHRPPTTPSGSAFTSEDVDAALADMHETFDITRADLDALLARAAHHAAIRRGRSGRS